MIKKLRGKLLIFNMLVLSVVIFSAFAFVYAIYYNNVEKENSRKIAALPLSMVGRTIVTNSTNAPQNGGESSLVFWGYSALPINYAQSFIVCIDGDGEITDIYTYIDMPLDVYVKATNKALSSSEKSGKQKFSDRVWMYEISQIQTRPALQNVPDFRPITEGSIQISFLDITDSQISLTNLLLTLIFVSVGMIAVLFFVSLFFANRWVKPIEENWQKQKQFVTDASHELKTPLAIISANLDAIRSNEGETVQSQTKWMSYIDTEIIAMNKLVSDLLYLSKSEMAEYQGQEFDLSKTANDTVSTIETIIYENNIALTTDIQPNIIVYGDEEKLGRVLLILLDNACKYTPSGENIYIKLEEIKGNAVFTVINSGASIPPEKLPLIFERFYRADDSRESGGYGLGLSIAKSIVERAGGQIFAQSKNDITSFTVVLKLQS